MVSKITKLCLFLTALFSTMPIVTFVISGHDISFFSIFLILTTVIFIRKLVVKREFYFRISKPLLYYIDWLLLSLIGSICGLIYFGSIYQPWFDNDLSYIPKIVLYIIFAIMCSTSSNKEDNKVIIYGYFAGCIANLIWASIDGLMFYTTNESINNMFFSGYIERMNVGQLSLILQGGFRTGGFNSDPAHIGSIAPVVALFGLYKRKYILILLSFFSLIFSQSTTGFLCIVIGIIANITILAKSGYGQETKNTSKNMLILFIAFSIIYIMTNDLSAVIVDSINKFALRIGGNYLDASYVTQYEPRVEHLLNVFPAIINAGPFMLFGTGFGTMSYAYTMGDNDLIRNPGYRGQAYDIDATYLDYLFDTGIVGLILYCSILFVLFKHYRKLMRCANKQMTEITIIYFGIFSLIITHFTYHYVLTANQVLLIIVSLVLISKEKC